MTNRNILMRSGHKDDMDPVDHKWPFPCCVGGYGERSNTSDAV